MRVKASRLAQGVEPTILLRSSHDPPSIIHAGRHGFLRQDVETRREGELGNGQASGGSSKVEHEVRLVLAEGGAKVRERFGRNSVLRNLPAREFGQNINDRQYLDLLRSQDLEPGVGDGACTYHYHSLW